MQRKNYSVFNCLKVLLAFVFVAVLFAGCANTRSSENSSQNATEVSDNSAASEAPVMREWTCCTNPGGAYSPGCIGQRSSCETPECALSELMNIAPSGASSGDITCTMTGK
jgi:hypothetical protein